MSTPSLFQDFEDTLDPRAPETSSIPCKILGYGEISCVLSIGDAPELAAKRMPLFTTSNAAQQYIDSYGRYCQSLRDAGLDVPLDRTEIVKGHGKVVTLYILQEQLPPERFCHKLIHTQSEDENLAMLDGIIDALEKVWAYNAQHMPELEIAIDGQISNWVYSKDGGFRYIDTSTPLLKVKGVETLDPELLLQSAPSFLRWLIRWQFLDDVMARYYDRKLVYTDLIANLYKEQRPELVDAWISRINTRTKGVMEPLTAKEISAYYKEDKIIWKLFLGLRRMDRWIKTWILHQRYEFVLPGKIKR